MPEIVWLILDTGLALLSVIGLILVLSGLNVFRFYLPMYFVYLTLFLLINYLMERRK
ncbi:MAG: hypothetical protein ACE5IB_00950 [Candidatus Geothermarchaeales archaeon]